MLVLRGKHQPTTVWLASRLDLLSHVEARFETSDARYLWLNRIQAVDKGFTDASQRLTCDF